MSALAEVAANEISQLVVPEGTAIGSMNWVRPRSALLVEPVALPIVLLLAS